MYRKANRQEVLKVILPAIAAVILFCLVLFGVIIPNYRASLLEDKKEMIRELTRTAWKILETMHKKEANAALSRSEAQRLAAEQVRALRYGADDKDYFWINDQQSIMLMHPYRQDLEGKDLSNFADPNGKRLFLAFSDVVRQQGEGYVDYMWQRLDDSSTIVPKLSYVKGFPPWGWIIGTGIYLEDVNQEIATLTQKAVALSFLIVALVVGLATFLAAKALRAARLRRQAEDDLLAHQAQLEGLVAERTMALTTSNEQLQREVEERRQAEALLKEQHGFLNTIIESLPYPFYVVNVKDYTIELSNSLAARERKAQGATCFVLSHGRSTPCDATADYTCPMQEVKRDGMPVFVEHAHVDADGNEEFVEVHASPVFNAQGEIVQIIEYAIDITPRKRIEKERERLIVELRDALENIKTLRGIVPICSVCKKVRDDQGYWSQVERYISQHSQAEFSHTYCPKCLKEHYPEMAEDMENI